MIIAGYNRQYKFWESLAALKHHMDKLGCHRSIDISRAVAILEDVNRAVYVNINRSNLTINTHVLDGIDVKTCIVKVNYTNIYPDMVDKLYIQIGDIEYKIH